MSTLSCVCLLACVVLALTCQPGVNSPCCMCGPNITVTMEVVNSIKPPTFKSCVKLEMHQRELIYFLQEAVAIDQLFQFTNKNNAYTIVHESAGLLCGSRTDWPGECHLPLLHVRS
ncbi:uncharacterized protein LOC124110714 isoform X2 [Haliotis rufescens]|uniref:uncharacterized protein LOC124110714 isoform X2 n=1 Tax=Haliotis rufescens TaxID=6454 RepID=UPI001EB05651|nr:uncharacterized protein LOC124110714 isoform X2 [Haliotis rufescens]